MISFPRWVVGTTSLAILGLLCGGAWFYVAQEERLRKEAEANLRSIAELKVEQIADWRAERLADAAVVMESLFLREGVTEWLAEPRAGVADKILARFRAFRDHENYHDVLLVDAHGKVRLSLGSPLDTLHEEAAKALDAAVIDRRPVLTDLHVGPGDLPPHLDVIAPIFATRDRAAQYVGAIVLQADARRFLYPFVHSWPTPSRSAETALVRRDGDAVLFLNDLRFRKDAALQLRILLSREDVPAVKAVLGKKGVVQGKDYRGVEVLSFARAVPQSPWFLLAKVDEAEALAERRWHSIFIVALVLAIVVALAAAVGVIWQRNAKAHYQTLFHAEAARRKSEERYQITLMSIGDGVIATDAEGRVELLNRVAEVLTGWRQEEARGKPVEEVFRIVDEETGLPVENPVRRVIREGLVMGLGNSTVLNARDGTERPIADSGAPIRDDYGAITGAVLVFRDQTQERATRKALLVSQDKFAKAFHASPDVLVISRRNDGLIIETNEKWEATFGYTREEAIGRTSLELALFADPEDRRRAISQLEDQGFVRDLEVNVRKKSGEIRQTILSVEAIEIDDEPCMVTIIHDITERKRTEAALRMSEAKLSDAVRMARLGHWEYDHEKDLFTFNDHFYELFRTTAEQVGGYTMSSADYARRFVHPDDISVVGDGIRKGLEATSPQFSDRLEHRILYGDGEIGNISVTVSIVKDELGRTVRAYGVNQDITERKRAEEAIRKSEERYRTLFDQSKDGVYMTTRNGQLLEANQAFLDLFGFTWEEAENMNTLDIFPEPAAENRERFRQDIEKTGSVKDYEITLKTKDGRLIDCLTTSSLKRAPDGTILGRQGIVRDVTQYKQLQNELIQAQKMEAIGTLAGGVAHDFNNLLQIILGYSELITDDEQLPARYKADLERILQASKDGADLVQRLLTFSRKTEVNPRPLNLNRRIEQLKKMLSRTIPKMIAIELDLADDLAAISADPTQIDQILMNLAVNARDAMPEGGTLTIMTKNVNLDRPYAGTNLRAAPGRYVSLSVSDTGLGMDTQTLEHIFDPFFTTKRAGEGTGLGLAMVYGIVKQHGGHIMCYSKPTRGTTFKMYFPALVWSEEPLVAETRPLQRGGSETILIVDDEELLRDLGSRILTKAGYRVITASNGKEALEVYQERGKEISLVILDLIMPEMGGRECLDALLYLNPTARVIIASGYSPDGTTKEALASRTKGFIDKPYDIRQVLEVVRKALDEDISVD